MVARRNICGNQAGWEVRLTLVRIAAPTLTFLLPGKIA